MPWAGCACSSAVACRGVSCTVCSEEALSPACCACCAAAARARRCFTCATGCTSVNLVESLRQAGCLRPKAGGGCVSAWSVCVAVRGAACRVQCCRAGRASGWRCRGRVIVARARVQGRGVASVSRAGRARGVAARRRRTSIFSHVDFCVCRIKWSHSTCVTPCLLSIRKRRFCVRRSRFWLCARVPVHRIRNLYM